MAKFCPNCGTPTVKITDGGRERDACPNGDFIQYANASLGVGALVFRDGKALVVERGIPPVGVWTIPGGYVEQDDDVQITVIRELKEETGLDIEPQGIVFLRNAVGEQVNSMYVVFLCELIQSKTPCRMVSNRHRRDLWHQKISIRLTFRCFRAGWWKRILPTLRHPYLSPRFPITDAMQLYSDKQETITMAELFDIYDENLQKIGTKPRHEVHRDGDWHRVFHCWVIYRDTDGKDWVVLQKRGPNSRYLPALSGYQRCWTL